MTTTAMASSFKQEMPEGAHCFLATQASVACTGASGAYTLTGLASTALLAVGMTVTGTGVGAGAVVSAIQSTTAVTLSVPNTATVSAATFTADQFNMLLVKVSPTGTYDSTLANAGTPGAGTPSTSNVGTDETSGTGYTSGGFTMTNVNPASSGTTAYWTFAANPSWTSATFSAIAGVIYNKAARLGGVANRVVGNFDFGGTQTVSSGTFTVTLPSATSTTAILRIQ